MQLLSQEDTVKVMLHAGLGLGAQLGFDESRYWDGAVTVQSGRLKVEWTSRC